MRPTSGQRKAVTPGSVKVLMLVEAGIIGFLSYWVLSEYNYNAYFHGYVDQVLLNHVTTYTAILGLGIGLAGSAMAATLYKNLQHAKLRLETVAVPKIRGAVEKVISTMPGTEVHSTSIVATEATDPQPGTSLESSRVTAIVPVPTAPDEKKRSS